MRRPRLHRFITFTLVLAAVVSIQACRNANPVETVNISLKNSETYSYRTVGGDEDGARISTQAKHYSISEIRRDAETNWVAVYVYRPTVGYVGSDYAAIEVLTGSFGASAPTSTKRVAFRFHIHD